MIHHVASRADWDDALARGSYTTSTRGRTLAQQGFLHCAYASQVAGVLTAFYADAPEPLVLLGIDTGRLDVPWREDEVAPGLRFPHVYGPLRPTAVVSVTALVRDGDGRLVPPVDLV